MFKQTLFVAALVASATAFAPAPRWVSLFAFESGEMTNFTTHEHHLQEEYVCEGCTTNSTGFGCRTEKRPGDIDVTAWQWLCDFQSLTLSCLIYSNLPLCCYEWIIPCRNLNNGRTGVSSSLCAEWKPKEGEKWEEKDFEAQIKKLEKEAEERLDAKIEEMMRGVESVGKSS
jgi:hypothetical protein